MLEGGLSSRAKNQRVAVNRLRHSICGSAEFEMSIIVITYLHAPVSATVACNCTIRHVRCDRAVLLREIVPSAINLVLYTHRTKTVRPSQLQQTSGFKTPLTHVSYPQFGPT